MSDSTIISTSSDTATLATADLNSDAPYSITYKWCRAENVDLVVNNAYKI